jgi:flagellar FliL protein
VEGDEASAPQEQSTAAPTTEAAMSQQNTMPQNAGIQSISQMQGGQPPGLMYELDPKVVNLAEPGGLRYLQASIVLELWPLIEDYLHLEGEERILAEEKFLELIDSRRPVIDDIVTTTLSSKTFEQIATVEGKQALKDELTTAINEALGYQGVINVYFTNFVVQ